MLTSVHELKAVLLSAMAKLDDIERRAEDCDALVGALNRLRGGAVLETTAALAPVVEMELPPPPPPTETLRLVKRVSHFDQKGKLLDVCVSKDGRTIMAVEERSKFPSIRISSTSKSDMFYVSDTWVARQVTAACFTPRGTLLWINSNRVVELDRSNLNLLHTYGQDRTFTAIACNDTYVAMASYMSWDNKTFIDMHHLAGECCAWYLHAARDGVDVRTEMEHVPCVLGTFEFRVTNLVFLDGDKLAVYGEGHLYIANHTGSFSRIEVPITGSITGITFYKGKLIYCSDKETPDNVPDLHIVDTDTGATRPLSVDTEFYESKHARLTSCDKYIYLVHGEDPRFYVLEF
jgi:hypothetical protein